MYSDRDHQIRHRVQLPGGKQGDVVYRDHRQPPTPDTSSIGAADSTADSAADSTADHTGALDSLHVCFHCAGELAYPLDWVEEGPRHWRIVLRCPECEARREGVFEQATVERLDDELDRATGTLLSDLKQLTQANMEEEVEFFVRALNADLVIPSDFYL
jgi:hypothetical protein